MRIPVPTDDEAPIAEEVTNDWVMWYLNVMPWVCITCKLTNFGRNTKCARCKQPRPSHYVESDNER